MIDEKAKRIIQRRLKEIAMTRAIEIGCNAEPREIDEFIANILKAEFDKYESKSPLEITMELITIQLEAMREEAERHDADRSDS